MRGLVFLLLGGVVLAGLFVFIPKDGAEPSAAHVDHSHHSEDASMEPHSSGPASAATILAWEVRAGQVHQEPSSSQVRQGEVVQIQVLSDTRDEVHLHGYDYTLALQPGIAAILQFTAVYSGRFELELHHGHQVLGALTVLP